MAAPGPRAAPPPRGRSPPRPKKNPPTPPPPVSAARSLDSFMARGELQSLRYADIILVRGKHFQQLQNAGVQPEAVVVAVVDSVLSATLRLRVHGLDAVLVTALFQLYLRANLTSTTMLRTSTRMLFCKASKLSMLLVFMRSLLLLTLALSASLLDLVPKYFMCLATRPSG